MVPGPVNKLVNNVHLRQFKCATSTRHARPGRDFFNPSRVDIPLFIPPKMDEGALANQYQVLEELGSEFRKEPWALARVTDFHTQVGASASSTKGLKRQQVKSLQSNTSVSYVFRSPPWSSLTVARSISSLATTICKTFSRKLLCSVLATVPL